MNVKNYLTTTSEIVYKLNLPVWQKDMKLEKIKNPIKKISKQNLSEIKERSDKKIINFIRDKPDIKLSEKFKEWITLFMDKSNREYYGNATKCALKVYDTDNYNSASCIGYQNYRKLQNLLLMLLEEEQLGFMDLMKIGITKVLKGSYNDWDSFMERLGYFDSKSKIKDKLKDTFDFENLNIAIKNSRKKRGLKD